MMALDTLKGIKKIGRFELTRDSLIDSQDDKPIVIHEGGNRICFKIQNGAVKENGVNGCQVDTMIETAKIIIENLNKAFPCRENSLAITKLEEALMWLRERTRNRIERGVEGLDTV